MFSLSLVSWLRLESPFMFVWIFIMADAVMLTWRTTLQHDNAYILLNDFWITAGLWALCGLEICLARNYHEQGFAVGLVRARYFV